MTGIIEVVTQGDSMTGIGHVCRSIALVHHFNINGFKTRLRPVGSETFQVLKSWPDFSPKFLIKETDEAPILTLIDVPQGEDYWINIARSENRPVIALDYFGDQAPDLTISYIEHFNPIPAGRRISGLEYAVLRTEIRNVQPTASVDGVLVVTGGSDVKSLGFQLAKKLSEYFEEKVTLVLGPLAGNVDSTDTFEIIRTPTDLPQRMAACEWAVSNGGTSMLELMYLGKPVFVVPQTDAEIRFSASIEKRAGILGAGDITPEIIKKEKFQLVAARARELIDGQGSDRLLSEVKTFL